MRAINPSNDQKLKNGKMQIIRRIILFSIGFIGLFSIAFSGCSTEVGRIYIQGEGRFEESLALNGSPVNFWTDLDIEYSDLAEMEYQIVIRYPDGKTESLTCDPLDVIETRMERDAIVQGKTKISYLGKMACRAPLPEGKVAVTVDLDYHGKNVTVFRADLVFIYED